jgi:hypothetical protein
MFNDVDYLAVGHDQEFGRRGNEHKKQGGS